MRPDCQQAQTLHWKNNKTNFTCKADLSNRRKRYRVAKNNYMVFPSAPPQAFERIAERAFKNVLKDF